MDVIEVMKNHEFDIDKLLKYLNNCFGGNLIDQIKIKQFIHGQSNPTFLIDLNSKKIVLRKKPNNSLLKSAHLIDREFRIITELHKANFPVPKPIEYCNDVSIIGTEFYLMEYVDGMIHRDFRLSSFSPQERFEIFQEYIRVMALLHSIDYKKLGLSNFGKAESNYYKRQIDTWSRQYKSSETQTIKEMDFLIDKLAKSIPLNNSEVVSIVHGDLRLDNIIFDKYSNKILAVLDWELATLGNPIADLSYGCLFYHFPLSFYGLGNFDKGYYGIPTENEFKQIYFDFIRITSHQKIIEPNDKDWHFYLSFGCFRLAGISQGVYKRSLQGNASSNTANTFLQKTVQIAKLSQLFLIKSNESDFSFKIKKLKENSLFNFVGQNTHSERFYELYYKLNCFMEKFIYPNEKRFRKKDYNQRWNINPLMEEIKEKAKKEGLWNLFLPEISKLTNLEYAFLCQEMGRSALFAPEIFNCSAPDTGNMEVLLRYGNENQKERYLTPLLNGEIRSCFAMTEKGTPSSDATNIQSSIIFDKEKGKYIVNGRKWWISGAGDSRCKISIFMGITPNSKRKKHEQHSMILIPMDTKGVKIYRPMEVFGNDDAPHGHMDIIYNNVEVGPENIILGEGRGFEIAQGRLGPGRIHHCMRLIGLSERAIENILDRVQHRKVFGKLLKDHDSILKKIAKCRIELDQARLLVLLTAYKIDKIGSKNSKKEIAMIKVVVPNIALKILDRAMQIHGAEGLSQDTFLVYAYAMARTLRIADGPDEVHLDSIGKEELSLLAKF